MGNKYKDETIKYLASFELEVQGVTDQKDIVGALFGQTEGLLDQELELKQLQKTGRIGRIKLSLSNEKGRTIGKIEIPSSLNKVQTAIVAAMLESVDRVGPYECHIKLDKIVDVRKKKREQIAKRASEIMKKWNLEQQESRTNIADLVEKNVRKGRIEIFGPDRLYAGSQLAKSQQIILVEGRADINNLLNMDIENTIAIGGAFVPPTIVNLCKNREVIALLDGDRGGDMILKELLLKTKIEYVARAPRGKEVEDLSINDVRMALRNKVPIMEAKFLTENTTVKEFLSKNKRQTKSKHVDTKDTKRKSIITKKERKRDKKKVIKVKVEPKKPKSNGKKPKSNGKKHERKESVKRKPKKKTIIPSPIREIVNKTKQTFNAVFLNNKNEPVKTVPTKEVYDTLKTIDNVDSIVIDGVITQRLLDAANEKSVKLIAGAVVGDINHKPKIPQIATFNRM